MLRSFVRLVSVCAVLLGLSSVLGAQSAPIALSVDASDAPRRIFHVRETLQAPAGTLTLVYPKWIPGEHGPTGPITDLVGLKVSSGGQAIEWRRGVRGWNTAGQSAPRRRESIFHAVH